METRQGYTEEVEIDIKQMLIYCIEGAWRILLAGLLCLLLLGGYKFVKSFSAYRSLQGMVQTKLKSEGTDAELYELQRESYLSQIENLKKQLRQRTEYREESPLMRLNADDFYEARLSWFVTTNYQIDPDKTFQNPDRTVSVLKSYQSLLASGEFYRYVHERVSAKIPEKYLQELIESDADEQYGLLRLSIFGGEEKLVTEIMQAAEQFLDERKAPIAEVVAAHETCGFAAENLRSLLEISPEAEASGILLLGTDEALVKDVYEKINAGWEGEKLGFTGNILYSTAAVERLRDYRRVVLVEEKGKLPFEKLQQECEKLRLLQKEICGIMLL